MMSRIALRTVNARSSGAWRMQSSSEVWPAEMLNAKSKASNKSSKSL